jgi:genome maintenance exonuclease 1
MCPVLMAPLDLRAEYKPKFPVIEQINSGEFRTYRIPNGKIYPSQSSVVGHTEDKSFLETWRKRVGDREADRISNHAAKRGSALHLLSEYYLTQDSQFELQKRKTMPDALANFACIRRQLEHVSDVRAIELQMFSDELRIAGTVDLIATWRGKLCIIDYKTSLRLKKREWIDGYFMQTAGYSRMWKEHTGEQIEKLVILMAVDNQQECSVFEEEVQPNLKKLKEARLKFYEKFKL